MMSLFIAQALLIIQASKSWIHHAALHGLLAGRVGSSQLHMFDTAKRDNRHNVPPHASPRA